MIHGHGGNVDALAQRLGCAAADIVDMSSNVNPLGPPPFLMDHLARALDRVRRLPEADAGGTVARMAGYLGIAPGRLLAGNGTTELIYRLPRALAPERVLILGPTYADYADACCQCGISPKFLLTGPETGFRVDPDLLNRAAAEAQMVFICNPNNPTGGLLDPALVDTLCRRHPGTCFVVDESYRPFAQPGETLSRRHHANLAVLHSLSKIFTLPGLRIGFAAAHPDIIDRLRRFQQPWSMNSLATAAVDFLVDHPDRTDAFVADSVRFLDRERRRFIDGLAPVAGIRAFPGSTAFILLELTHGHRSQSVCAYLGERRVLIRDCANFNGLSDRFVRVSLKDTADNRRCVALLAAAVGR